MKKWVCSLFLLTIFSCSNETELSNICAKECYKIEDTSDIKFGLYSSCRKGKPVCDENNNKIDCEGAVYPSREVCDGLDNDCDGDVDEGLGDRQSQFFTPQADNPCMNRTGECAHALVQCRGGKLVCNYDFPGTIALDDDSNCDGLDNDCDGRIDESYVVKEPCFCLSENQWWKATNGQCKLGLEHCVNGEKICEGAVCPSKEVGCDDVDNDCNGVVDDSEEVLQEKYDIVFDIDTSGSMCPYITAVGAACDAYVEQFENNTNYRFAVVDMAAINPIDCWDLNENSICDPATEDRNGDGMCHVTDCPLTRVEVDFTDLATVRDTLITMNCTGGGNEASLDSMYFIADKDKTHPDNPIDTIWSLPLSWRAKARPIVFMFTDEPPQSFVSPEITNQDVVDIVLENNVLLAIWSNWLEFQYITSDVNGFRFPLVPEWEPIFENENEVIISGCSEK